MKVVFWSYARGHTGHTSNMVILASYLAIKHKKTMLLLQTQLGGTNLGDLFLGNSQKEEGEEGLDALLRIFKSEPLNQENIESCCRSLYQNRLRLLQGTSQKSKEIFQSEIAPLFPYCINAFDECFDYVFVDLESGKNEINEKLMAEADIIVVGLNQSRRILEDYFQHAKVPKEKVFYLIGQYQIHSKYTMEYICHKYRLQKRQVGRILQNASYMDAMSEGEVISYLLRILDSRKQDEDYLFLTSLEKTVHKFLAYLGNERKERL